MDNITKYVKKDGTGDYTDLVTAINDVISSGVSYGAKELVVVVDSETYSGLFNINVPNSGSLYIVGDSTIFMPTGSCQIDGDYGYSSNFSIYNMTIDGSYTNSCLFYLSDSIASSFDNCEFINTYKGFTSSGHLSLNNITTCSGNTFITGPGNCYITNSKILDYAIGVQGNGITLNSCVIANCTSGVINNSGNCRIDNSLFYSNVKAIYTNANFYLYKTTIHGTIPITLGLGTINTWSIYNSIVYSTSGPCINNSNVACYTEYSVLYPSGFDNPSLSGVNCTSEEPIFNDINHQDFRLSFNRDGSDCCSICTQFGVPLIESGIEISVDKRQFIINSEENFNYNYQQFTPFIYNKDSTIIFTDYGRETQYADVANSIGDKDLYCCQLFNILFSEYNVSTSPSLTSNGHYYPYDWDYKIFNTTEITDRHKYITPRSVVNIKNIVQSYPSLTFAVLYSKINKDSVKVYNATNYRGVSYDYDLSKIGEQVLWSIEGNNQLLLKLNAYTGDVVETYPLLCHSIPELVTVSGLIYLGPKDNVHRFLLQSDPGKEIEAISDKGYFYFIDTSLNQRVDFKGILVYKDNLFITATEYTEPVTDRSSVPYGSGIGKLYQFDNNNTFEHFIDSEPTNYPLCSGNIYPTDITIYEDGSIYIADYYTIGKIFKYNFNYDYGFVQASYDKESRLMLRENYNEINI